MLTLIKGDEKCFHKIIGSSGRGWSYAVFSKKESKKNPKGKNKKK